MNSSNLSVNFDILSLSSSKPKLIEGNESAIDGASAVDNGARMVLVEKGVSMIVVILNENWTETLFCGELCFVNM